MAFWNRDKSTAQKHSIIEVIKYDGPNDIFVWKFPNEDFNTNTQLIVGPSQEAIFVKGGQVLEHISVSGTYSLNTKNYPFIRSLVGLVTGGVSPFSCTVYYVNKAVSMGIEWGTDSPIRIIDPAYGVPVNLTGYGDFSLQVSNGHKMLEKLVGMTSGYSHEEIKQHFSGMMAAQIRSVLTTCILGQNLSLYGIDSRLPELSAAVQEQVASVFEPYGLEVNHFAVAKISYSGLEEIEAQIAKEAKTNIAFTQDTHRHRITTDLEAEDKRKMAQAQAFENRELGVSEQQKMVGRAMETMASNPGPVMGGAGGIGFPGMIGGNIVQPSSAGTAEMARMLLNQSEQPAQQPAMNMGGVMPGGGMFGMMEEAEPQPAAQPVQESFEERARKAKFMLDNGYITQEQYQEKISQIMSEI